MTVSNRQKELAHNYARTYGFAVVPLAPRTKRPLVRGGFKAASRDPVKIESWWNLNPQAGVAIATGAASGIIVLDQDPRNEGEENYAAIRMKYGAWGDAPICLTGGGGTHEYFRHPGEQRIPCRSNLGGFSGIDLKGDDGYVVAPPSIHPNGKPYEWDLMFGIESVEIGEPPEWLVQLARTGPQSAPAAYESATWNGELPDRVAYFVATRPLAAQRFRRDASGLVDSSPSGIDFSLACSLAHLGCDGATIEAGVRASRASAGLPGKQESYFRSTIGKALHLASEDRQGD